MLMGPKVILFDALERFFLTKKREPPDRSGGCSWHLPVPSQLRKHIDAADPRARLEQRPANTQRQRIE
jgi:hypothetical protein